MKYKINDRVTFKAESLNEGVVVGLPDEDTNMYTIELSTGSTIRCTEHYIEVSNAT
jgi:hypothetical protein|tara:strand:+ start:343 stop:510 length:168 start_codon:yes stop_codon:yes gene_type:complete